MAREGRLRNATVAVVGGTGFVGRNIVERLALEGASIKVLTRNPERAKPLKPMGWPGQIAIVAGDALDKGVLKGLFAGCDAVVNTVGILSERGRQRFDGLHAELPGRLGKRARKAGVGRLVHLSAIGANPKSNIRYAASKGRGEKALRAAFPGATILRPSLIFGAGDGFYNRFAAMAALAPGLPLVGGGRNKVQPVYVGDVADAVTACLARDDTAGRTFELGGPEVFTFREVMAYILAQVQRRRALVPVPHFLMMLAALPLGLLPDPPVTRDQLRQLKRDNVVASNSAGLGDLGIAPTPVDLVVPDYLARYRPGGRFAAR